MFPISNGMHIMHNDLDHPLAGRPDMVIMVLPCQWAMTLPFASASLVPAVLVVHVPPALCLLCCRLCFAASNSPPFAPQRHERWA